VNTTNPMRTNTDATRTRTTNIARNVGFASGEVTRTGKSRTRLSRFTRYISTSPDFARRSSARSRVTSPTGIPLIETTSSRGRTPACSAPDDP
jgi:hypothetical protein